MQIIYRPEKEQPPRKGNWVCGFIVFRPGANEVSSEAISTLLENPTFNQYVSIGAIELPVEAASAQPLSDFVEVVNATKSLSDLSDLSSLTTAEAKPVIAATDDLELLHRWQAAEDRVGVGELLSDRIAELEPPF